MDCGESGMPPSQPEAFDVVDVLVQRIAFMECLRKTPRQKPALVTELDVARATVDRAIRSLETMNLIEQSADGYHLTTTGQQVTTDVADLMAEIDEVQHERSDTPTALSPLAVLETVLQRREILTCLLNEPSDKRALVDALGISRATVDRSVRELETLGLLTYGDGRFTVTAIGELATFGLCDLAETITLRQQLAPFLQWVPAGSLDIDLHHLADAELLVPEPGDPWAMVNRHVQVLKDMTSLRCLLPLTGLHAIEVLHDRIVHASARCEAVIEPCVADTFRSSPDYADRVEDMRATDRFELFVYEGSLPYFLGVFAEQVQIGVDEDNQPRAMLETAAAEVREWAEQTYNEYKQQAEPIER
jgi:predicted transcriptional regulator